jgi:hypothetical protein
MDAGTRGPGKNPKSRPGSSSFAEAQAYGQGQLRKPVE